MPVVSVSIPFLLAKGLRLGAALQWLILIFWIFRARQTDRRSWILLIFATTVISFLLIHVIVSLFPTQKMLWWPFLVGAFAVPPMFWIASSALFQDRFRLSWIHAAAVIGAELFGFATAHGLPTTLLSSSLVGKWIVLFPQIMDPFFVVLALVQIQKSARSDLNESRLHFRKVFSWGTGLATLLVAACETAGKAYGPLLYPLDAVMAVLIFLLGYLLAHYAQHGKSLFPEWWREPDPASLLQPLKEVEPALALGVEARAALARMMDQEKIYRRSDLDLNRLSCLLNTPEYRVRRYINRELGFQNFNQYINRYRLEEAKRILSAADSGQVPIYNLAIDLGFGSVSSFNRVFKDATGMSPSQYRASREQQLPVGAEAAPT